MDEVGYILKKNEREISCEVVYPNIGIADILRKKSETYQKLNSVVKTPKVYRKWDEIRNHLPLFVKPDVGYGSRGAQKIENESQLSAIANRLDEMIVMEHLPGDEYTIDCFSSNENELLFAGARKRERVRMGISVSTKTVNNQKPFWNIAKKINDALNLRGLWFFQLKRDKNSELKLLEVAGRVSGSMALYRGMGINFVASDLFQRMGAEITLPEPTTNEALLERAFDCSVIMNLNYETVYCDLDDCLIIDDKVNKNMVGFLYQCLNEGKKLVLITRHKLDLHNTLKEYRLETLFDEIKHIQDRDISKASCVKNKNAIFIDDSFVERESVAIEHNIPTFAPDGIDLLLKKG